jgi:hypothetical protein
MRFFAVALAICTLGMTPAQAQSDRLALAVKATFLVKFGAYVAWPVAALADGAPLSICTIGDGQPLDGLLDSAAKGQGVGGHAVVVRHLATVDRGSGCQIVWLGDGQAGAMSADAPILTVTDAADAAHRGMIDFEIVDGRVRFSVDQDAASAAGLTISSKLLQIAVSVRQAGK